MQDQNIIANSKYPTGFDKVVETGSQIYLKFIAYRFIGL